MMPPPQHVPKWLAIVNGAKIAKNATAAPLQIAFVTTVRKDSRYSLINVRVKTGALKQHPTSRLSSISHKEYS